MIVQTASENDMIWSDWRPLRALLAQQAAQQALVQARTQSKG